MNLLKKKELAARTLNVGKDRIVFNIQRLDEIKEAITKQDIKDLFSSKAIVIKEISGRKVRHKKRRRAGSIKKRPAHSKRIYIILTRKLRKHLSVLKRKGQIKKEKFIKLRQEIRASAFKSLAQLKDRISE